MADDLTPWEEINPPMVSAPQRGLPSKCLDRLTPASNVEFRNELTACLALTAPAGMTEEGRGEWLAVAWETLKHLPPDLLAMGCRKARETCDHPSKIVPAIVEATKDSCASGTNTTARQCAHCPNQSRNIARRKKPRRSSANTEARLV
jgi:hypothetical protein